MSHRTSPARRRRGAAVRLAISSVAAITAVGLVPGTASAEVAPQTQEADQTTAAQVLTWTADDDITEYTSAPTEATAGPATIVFENSLATGNTFGMAHTLTFDTSTPGYNHDVNLNILASPFDANGGRHEAEVTLTPGTLPLLLRHPRPRR